MLIINNTDNELIIVIHNDIVAAPRPRVTRFGVTYYPKKYNDFRNSIINSINNIDKPLKLINAPINIDIKFEFKIPKSYTTNKRKELESIGFYHTNKPDIDNIIKSYLDILVSSNILSDDSIVSKISAVKKYNPDISKDIVTIIITHIESTGKNQNEYI